MKSWLTVAPEAEREPRRQGADKCGSDSQAKELSLKVVGVCLLQVTTCVANRRKGDSVPDNLPSNNNDGRGREEGPVGKDMGLTQQGRVQDGGGRMACRVEKCSR